MPISSRASSPSTNNFPLENIEYKVTYERVAELADEILAKGELPSVLCIRGLLSDTTVSNAEISYYLERWQTQRIRSGEALRLRDRAIESSPNGIVIIDISQSAKKIIYANAAYVRITGTKLEKILNKKWGLLDREPNQLAAQAAHLAFSKKREARVELNWYQKDGTVCWCELYLAPVPETGGGAVKHYVGILVNITDRKLLEQQLTHQATHDSLTNLPNRTLLLEHLNQAFMQANREGKMVAVLFLDLDQFKLTNDVLGHDVGDVLLREVGMRLRACLRKGDIVARLGGDEFIIVLSYLSHPEQVLPVVQTVLANLRKSFKLNEYGESVILSTASVGVSFYPKDGDNAKTLLKNADIAMYKAKELGRNTFQVFNPKMNVQLTHRVEIERDLHKAVKNKEFALYLQPIVDLNTRKIIGFEGLLRWQHPMRGMVYPLEFIPIAEETNLIVSLGEWTLIAACEIYKKWKELQLPEVFLAINVSGRQLNRHEFFNNVKKIIEHAQVNPGFFHLEVTESILINGIERVTKTLSHFRELGISISIDDFGTGYSSLNYLKSFPVDKLKIDRSFIKDMVSDESNAAITQAIIAIARSLQMKVVAEGVENTEQLAFLQKLQCDEIQGYYFSPPVTVEEATHLLQQQQQNKLVWPEKK